MKRVAEKGLTTSICRYAIKAALLQPRLEDQEGRFGSRLQGLLTDKVLILQAPVIPLLVSPSSPVARLGQACLYFHRVIPKSTASRRHLFEVRAHIQPSISNHFESRSYSWSTRAAMGNQRNQSTSTLRIQRYKLSKIDGENQPIRRQT